MHHHRQNRTLHFTILLAFGIACASTGCESDEATGDAGMGGSGGSGSGGMAGDAGMAGSGGTSGAGGGVGVTGFESCTAVNTADGSCECDPFDEDTCDQGAGSTLTCSINFIAESAGGFTLPVLGAHDGAQATECLADSVQPASEGESCDVTTMPATEGDARRDTCTQGLFCDARTGDRRCVRLCGEDEDCDAPVTCTILVQAGNPAGVEAFGACLP